MTLLLSSWVTLLISIRPGSNNMAQDLIQPELCWIISRKHCSQIYSRWWWRFSVPTIVTGFKPLWLFFCGNLKDKLFTTDPRATDVLKETIQKKKFSVSTETLQAVLLTEFIIRTSTCHVIGRSTHGKYFTLRTVFSICMISHFKCKNNEVCTHCFNVMTKWNYSINKKLLCILNNTNTPPSSRSVTGFIYLNYCGHSQLSTYPNNSHLKLNLTSSGISNKTYEIPW